MLTKNIPRPLFARRAGAALVFVLAALALISFLALAILTLIRSEDRSSRTAADLTELRLMAEMPEKLVISQIRRATKGLGTRYTWTSQPGMIRVFGNEATDGKRPPAVELFKLYSAPLMTLPQGSDPLKDAQDFQNWATQPGVFTDLNEPVRVLPVREQGQVQSYDQPTFQFPILDPGAVDLYDGFKIDSKYYDPNTQNPRLPMPVAWLYVLKNGKIAAATSGGEGKARVSDATADNPIIGRIAFWTDDESCKLNLNTATEPAPWDTPHTRTVTDEAYAQSIPAKGEFYRMSGHPAYTSLAPVLRKFGKLPGDTSLPKRESQASLGDGEWWRHLQDYHRLLPRTIDTDNSDDGTQGGVKGATDQVLTKQERLFTSVDEFFFNTKLSQEQRTPNSEVSPNIPATQEDVRKSRFFLTTHSRAPELNPFNRPKISLWPVQQNTSQRNDADQAFAQAATLGDDIYCFQRASEWTSVTSPGSSQSQDEDMNVQRNSQLVGYMLDLTERDIPGFGGRFVNIDDNALGKYSSESRDQLLVSMFDMIRWGVNPATPYAQKIDPTLDPQYSYLPPGFGQAGATGTFAGMGGWTAAPLRVPDIGEMVEESQLPAGQKALAESWAKGFGRYPTITEVAVVFAATAAEGFEDTTPTSNFADRTKQLVAFVVVEPWLPNAGVPSAAPNYEVLIEGLNDFKLTSLDKDTQLPIATIPSHELGFKPSVSNIVTFSPARSPKDMEGHPLGGGASSYAGFASQFLTPDGDHRDLPPADEAEFDPRYHFKAISAPIDLDVATEGAEGTLMNFSGGLVRVSILEANTGKVVQTLQVNFPETQIPMPLVATADGARITNALRHQMQNRFRPTALAAEGSPAQMTNLLRPGDVVRSIEVFGENERTYPPGGFPDKTAMAGVTRGDLRLIAGRVIAKQPWDLDSATPSAVQQFFFAPHIQYYETTITTPAGTTQPCFQAHSLRDGAAMLGLQPGGQPTLATTGRLVGRGAPEEIQTLEPLPDSLPATPPGTAAAYNLDDRPGDFDTGPGIIEDGPYIGVPDFNNSLNQSTARPATTNATTSGWFERGGAFGEEDGITFMPWRQAASGFIFGSLPTGVYGRGGNSVPRPWQTLLLCPNPPSRSTAPESEPKWNTTTSTDRDHFGFSSPRDHLWLEFFHLPVTEPEGFGDAVSTEGKVNMNYQMMPFTWIKRATAMHGALHGVRLTAIPSAAVGKDSGDQHYKRPEDAASSLQFRYAVDAEKTLQAFDELRLRNDKDNDVFRSPSEICDMWLVPQRIEGHTYAAGKVNPTVPPTDYTGLLDWWEGSDKADPTDGFEATGDNLREAPYAQLYPRLCTKSNVFTVHYRVQLLKKSRSTQPNEWDEKRDSVAAEHRGQTTVERYLDLNKKTIPDFVTTINPNEALDDYYDIRVVNRRDFKP